MFRRYATWPHHYYCLQKSTIHQLSWYYLTTTCCLLDVEITRSARNVIFSFNQVFFFFLQESIFLWKKDSLFTKRHRLTNKSKCRPPQNGGNVEMDHWTSYHHSEFRTARLLDSLSLRNMLHGQGRAFECWFFLIFQKQWENFTSPMTFVRLHLKMATTSFLKRIDGTRQKEMKLDLPLFYVWGFFIWLRIDNATV